jgi:glutamate/tyrosine decarboxylase-like PLP-dependent enzyme
MHKYGYAFKGASIVAYRSRELLEQQFFWYDAWPGGLYASSTPAGTRPAPPIAGAWAAINHLGVDGYMRMAGQVLDATTRFREGIDAIDGLTISREPDMSVMEVTADPAAGVQVDINGVGDAMDDRGWHLDRQPGGLHLMLSPYHLQVADRFLADLADAVAQHGASRGTAATYGGVA